MGFAIAAEAARRGAEVTLVAGPTTVQTPNVRTLVRVRGAEEMCTQVLSHADGADVVIMAAAVTTHASREGGAEGCQVGRRSHAGVAADARHPEDSGTAARVARPRPDAWLVLRPRLNVSSNVRRRSAVSNKVDDRRQRRIACRRRVRRRLQ